MRKVGKAGAALAAIVLIAGCGDDDGGGSAAEDRKAIEAVAAKAVSTKDAEVKCVEAVTANFVKTVYGSLETCRKEESEFDPAEPATGARVAGLKIDGDSATADVTTVGGTSDKSHGEITFAKDGDDWKIDALSAAFMRSRMTIQVAASRDGPFVDATVRGCFTERMAKVPDDEFLKLAYQGISGGDPHPTFLRILQECSTSTRDDSGISVLRKQFEQGITEAAQKDGTPQKAIDCVLQGLRRSISDDEIIDLSSNKNRAELTKRVARAMANCGATG